ncbi:uncharacterized protein LOC132198045 isoform X2 [Neocloeon triangulifer]|uniref:uncharacterized protein LOC132198045 isoform X2 n=1 Tax=Neocloeon triangulifer TaxID=2078957 RepID=UPI00286EFF7B|nr:uncharacterized protein LOC132198045 isoform X2 [Neocloeon triangulifer]
MKSNLASIHGAKKERKLSTPTIIHPVRSAAPGLPPVPPRNLAKGPSPPPPQATDPPSQSASEVKYPFGVQNDLGQVILGSASKEVDRQERPTNYHLLHELGLTASSCLANTPTSPPLTPGPPARPHSRRDLSPSRLSFQSASLQCSLASSATDLSLEATQLERAIRTNDTLRVKRFLDVHHDKFQVNLHGSILDKSSSETQSQDVEILLRKSKTLIDRLDANGDEREPEVPSIFINALHVAVMHGSVDVVRLLLKYGLEPDQQGSKPGGEFGGRLSDSGANPNVLTPESPFKKRRAHISKSLPRQRSFSLDSEVDLTNSQRFLIERRSVSVKSSPNISQPPPPPPEAGPPSPCLLSPTDNENLLRPVERSIFAELRRSSEIFKSILLNLSTRDATPATVGPNDPNLPRLSRTGKESGGSSKGSASPVESSIAVDLAGLLAAHEQRRLAAYQHDATGGGGGSHQRNHVLHGAAPHGGADASYTSESSVCSSDTDDLNGGVTTLHLDISASDDHSSLLRLNPLLSADKVDCLHAHVYTKQYLFSLPTLFLACVKGHASLVSLLLKYGASANTQDGYGNTPLHICLCQANIPWECVLDLLEHGAQISICNRSGLTPFDLAPSSLAKLQYQMLLDCWAAFRVTNNASVPATQAADPQAQAQSDSSPQQVTAQACGAGQSGAPAQTIVSKPQGILRRIHEGLKARTDSEEVSSASAEVLPGISTAGSVKSKGSNPEISISKDNQDGISKQDSRKIARRKAMKEKHDQNSQAERHSALEAERSFQVLLRMAGNPECLGYVLRGLLAHIPHLLRLLQSVSDTALHRATSALLHNVLKTAVETYGIKAANGDAVSRRELSGCLCLVLRVCLSLIHGVHDLQYTAMVTINKVIDACVIHRLSDVKVHTSQALRHPCTYCDHQETEGLPRSKQRLTAENRPTPAAKRLGSVWRQTTTEVPDAARKPEELAKEESVLDVLSSVHALSVLNILHNALTLYKRVVGSKQQCTPSQRWRHCSYHCLQLLAARALLFMSKSSSVQDQLVQDPQLRILIAALDSTHDPQLLVLVLQIVAILALEPKNHKPLCDMGLPDALSQLLLPSDEWYYTNHSTKYARYVKHHAARTLVYLGLQHRVNLRISVYDILQEEAPPPTPLLESVEDNYIAQTSSSPSLVTCAESGAVLGLSVEGAVMFVLRALEGSVSADLATLEWILSGSSYESSGINRPQTANRPKICDPSSTEFVQTFLSCFSCVLNPLVLVRLLLHRLLTTATHLQRWKSCASRSSFASAPDPPKSPRSRASSTDTEPSTLRKRRKVNLTLDCIVSGDGEEEQATCPTSLHVVKRPLQRQEKALAARDSFGSATALEPAIASTTLFAFSHMFQSANSRESLTDFGSAVAAAAAATVTAITAASASSSKSNTPNGSPTLIAGGKRSFRFSSMKKRRSKSHANIAPPPAKLLLQQQQSRERSKEHAKHRCENPEQEILAFQRQLQNLPDFDSPEHPGPHDLADILASGGSWAARPFLRPRSRSVPRVTPEGARFLTLPEMPWGGGGGITHTGGSLRLPRGRSAGALGLDRTPSPATTPVEERAGSQPPMGTASRRSSLTPSDRSGGRRRDSPACMLLEVPPWHKAILSFIEEWLRVSRVDLACHPPLCKELRDFLVKVSACGIPYQQWSCELRQEFPSLTRDPEQEAKDDQEETDSEYIALRRQVVSGDLPCSKEEAAALAGIQLRLEESWGKHAEGATPAHAPLSPQELSTSLKPISEDKESLLLHVPSFGAGATRCVSPLTEETEGSDYEQESSAPSESSKRRGVAGSFRLQGQMKTTSLLRRCYPSSSAQAPFLTARRLEDCLPPCYHCAKTMPKLIKEQKRKLFHTSVYESEVQLKKLYIQTCKRLPCYGCKVYQVKELLRGKTKKKLSNIFQTARLLGLGSEKIVLLDTKTKILAKAQNTLDLLQWRTGGGRSHDRLQLEFRGSRWQLAVPSPSTMREVGLALWEILQELDHSSTSFLDSVSLLFPPSPTRRSKAEPASAATVKRSLHTLQVPVVYASELEALYRLLHFPEEVALRLTATEHHLFYQVPPIDYLRQVTLDLATGATNPPPPDDGMAGVAAAAAAANTAAASATPARPSVRDLIKRFNEVSSWVTHLIISQPTHEDRKAVLSCILRVALSCWNMANFNGAMEIVAGLKSKKLKPFWLSITEKESVPVLDFLSAALMSAEYERALARALAMPECRVVPFFGAFLRELREIVSNTPSLVVLAPPGAGEAARLEQMGKGTRRRPSSRRQSSGSGTFPPQPMRSAGTRQMFISDYNGEDHFFTRIGPGGLINLDKVYRTQAVMDRIASFHQHFHARTRNEISREPVSIHTSSIERSYLVQENEEHDYRLDLDNYKPVQSMYHDHGVSFFPISAPHSGLDHHVLQVMHHGSTAVHYETDGSRSALVYMRLERSCSTLTWTRPCWSGLRGAAAGGPDYCLSANPEENIPPSMALKFASSAGGGGGGGSGGGAGGLGGAGACQGEVAAAGLEEGYLELSAVKEIVLGGGGKDKDPDIASTARRFGLEKFHGSENCLALVYGANLSDNRVLMFLCPPLMCKVWYQGLCWVVRGLKRQMQLTDRRIMWLKEQYLQLYFDEMCGGPMTADAIRVFGGRDWTLTGNIVGMSPPDNGTLKRGQSTKFRKKKSITNIQNMKDIGTKPLDLSREGALSTSRRSVTAANPPRSWSISSEIDTNRSSVLAAVQNAGSTTPSGSSEHLDNLYPSTSFNYPGLQREKKAAGSEYLQIRQFRAGSITNETQLDFIDFVNLFRSFSLRLRKDLRELFEQFATVCRTTSDGSLSDSSHKNSPEHSTLNKQKIGLLTRNSSNDLLDKGLSNKKKIFDAIAAASIVSNCAGVDTSKSQVITLASFCKFLETKQMEQHSEEEVKALIQRHEPDLLLRAQNNLSFEGFARYLMDKDNYAFVSERVAPDETEMDQSLSHYFIASSHNTYLTGHQLKGESSVELYSQVLLTGCRCVELDCWDGDDGSPLIYHGHTFTTKIPFRSVVEAINRSAFVTSPFPVILSIENHCSVQQQARMAHIFQSVFGDKLVTKFLYEADFSDDPCLPSPGQLRHRILIKNKKLMADIQMAPRGTRGQGAFPSVNKAASGRASSIVSNTSGGSVNDEFSEDDDDDDDDEDENLDEDKSSSLAKSSSLGPRTDSISSHEGAGLRDMRHSHPSVPHTALRSQDWLFDDDFSSHKPKKQSSQIAKELSDMIVYIQAIKFRTLNTISPNSSVRSRRPAPSGTTSSGMKKGTNTPSGLPQQGTSVPGTPTNTGATSSISTSSASSSLIFATTMPLESSLAPGAHSSFTKRPNVNHPCYQCSSLNENSAKKLCRKQPHALVAHTETQLMRTYPAGMRIDSSNFNPVIFWAFGIQMVALNYQTEDAALHLNTAMFEQNGRCGYVRKPAVMWDRGHMMYRRFNPWDKEFDGLHSVHLVLTIVSGQYVSQNNLSSSLYVEVEVIGIPVDCAKQKTKIIQRNAINPIWNDAFFFQIMFRELAFVRFSVMDANTNHLLSQRVLPLTRLRPGYRHVRLRSPQNQPMQLSTLFVYSRTEEESLDTLENNEVPTHLSGSTSVPEKARKEKEQAELIESVTVPLKRRMFFLMVFGVIPDEPYTILKITQESTTQEVIVQALQKANLGADKAQDYILVEEVARSWEKKDRDMPATQRVLDLHERPLQAQANWQGEGRFILKRMGDDPSSRAWLSSIRSTAGLSTAKSATDLSAQHVGRSWDDHDNFLVCVYNVSPEIPYAILKVPLGSSAQDVLAQALVKARRLEDPTKFVLVEELEWAGGAQQSQQPQRRKQQRILADDENVYGTQAHWQTLGRFVLRERGEVTPPAGRRRTTLNLRTATLEKLSKGLKGRSEKTAVHEVLSYPSSSRGGGFRSRLASTIGGGSGGEAKASSGPQQVFKERTREVHSEGETLSDEERDASDMRNAVARLKKVSLKKFKVWK